MKNDSNFEGFNFTGDDLIDNMSNSKYSESSEYIFSYYKKRNYKVLIAFILVSFGACIFFLINQFISSNVQRLIGYLIAAILLLAGIGNSLLIYLQGASIASLKNFNKADYNVQNSEIKAYSELVKTFANRNVQTENNSDRAISEIVLKEKNSHFMILVINEDLELINRRIKDATEKLSKSANVNLIFGSLSTACAIFTLAAQLFLSHAVKFDNEHLSEALLYYLPRITIVIFIEIFAFFFLKIYKENLNDIKYFQNEKTNIEQSILSLKIATLNGNQSTIEFVIKQLAKTERNFILKKGESTVELEKEKLQDKNYKNIIDNLKSILTTTKTDNS